MYTHNLEPVLFNIYFLEIRWYSLAYIVGITLGWWYAKKVCSFLNKSKSVPIKGEEFDNLISYLIAGIIVGGRMGYVIFYNPGFYLFNPMEILKIWEGGMSFHGGLIGIIISVIIFSRKNNLNSLMYLDVIACVAPIGLFLGRLANFINSELIGKPTQFFLNVIFPKIDELPRHPSQIYEALLEGVCLFFILNFLIFRKNYQLGVVSSCFLIFYGLFRIISEFFREPDTHLGYLFYSISMGTVLSMCMIVVGLGLYKKVKNGFKK